MAYKIYSIEDDKDIARIINRTLTHQGYEVSTFYNGLDFFKEFKINKPDMILLDMMLPDMSGAEILKTIRSDSNNDDIDIIIISANRMVMDKVDGLDLGADDYIEKPFDILELSSRVNARLRRHKKNKSISTSLFNLDLDKRIFKYKDKDIPLTVKEFDIMEILIENKGKVVSRTDLLSKIWGKSEDVESRTVDMHIKSIRNKCEDDSSIITIYGVGYKVVE